MPGGVVVVKGSQAYQLRRVLRLTSGDNILVLDNSGWEYQVELIECGEASVTVVIKNRNLASGEPDTKVTLYQSLLKGNKFDFVIEAGDLGGLSYPLF